jgi:hypothetical protein
VALLTAATKLPHFAPSRGKPENLKSLIRNPGQMNDLHGVPPPAAQLPPRFCHNPRVAMPLRLKVIQLGNGRWLLDTGRRIYPRHGQIVEIEEVKDRTSPILRATRIAAITSPSWQQNESSPTIAD